jgi:Flp pilus assembly protein TadB
MSITPSPSEHPAPAPAPGEEIHLPGPTILPVVAAVAITLIVVGTTLGLIFVIVGAVVLLVVAVRWIADTRRDVAVLPEQHQ